MKLKIILGLSLLLLIAFVCRNKTKINDEFEFCYYDNYGYCNIYIDGNPVIKGGCDSAKWNDKIIVIKGEKWRYDYQKTKLGCYHIINMTLYLNDPRQERSSGVQGPFSEEEFLKIDPLKDKKFIAAHEK